MFNGMQLWTATKPPRDPWWNIPEVGEERAESSSGLGTFGAWHLTESLGGWGAELDRPARTQNITWLVAKHGSHRAGGARLAQQQHGQVSARGLRPELVTGQPLELSQAPNSQGLFSQGPHAPQVLQELLVSTWRHPRLGRNEGTRATGWAAEPDQGVSTSGTQEQRQVPPRGLQAGAHMLQGRLDPGRARPFSGRSHVPEGAQVLPSSPVASSQDQCGDKRREPGHA